jgi:glycosyltransferase involved in cell wall biosynthesis
MPGRTMKILYHHRTQGRGAEGNHIVSIVNGMRSLGHEVDVLSPPGIDPFDRSATIPTDQAADVGWGWSRLWGLVSNRLPGALFEVAEIFYNLPAFFRLRAALRSADYDLLYERYATYLIAGALASKACGCPLLLEINEISGVADRVRRQRFKRLCGAVERWLLRRCDFAHAVSSYLGDSIVHSGFPAERVVVMPNGFDVDRIATSESRAKMREKFGFTDCIVIGFAGWFVPWDRLDLLVDVFAELRSEDDRLRLCLVGEGEVAREITGKLGSSPLADSIVITGAVPRNAVYDHLQMFDIGVLPHSNMFGSPMVMFEMMGLRVPIVAPRLPPIEDVLVHDETAMLFGALDRRQLRSHVSELVASPELRQRLADNALRRLEANHSWHNTAARILRMVTAQ